MDGVIIDSNPFHHRAWEVFNHRYGLEMTEEMSERMYGKRNDEIIRDFFGELTDEEVFARGAAKEAVYRGLVGAQLEQALVPGVREFLERHQDVPMAVASNAERANLEFVLNGAGLDRFFRVVLDGHQVTRPKPHPEVYQTAAARLGVSTANCIVFEDSYSGIEAATLADMRVVGIRTTHFRLPKTDLQIDNFCSESLEPWLLAQKSV
jgi:HAD superfamily hydrolase (TIGR01509 family)